MKHTKVIASKNLPTRLPLMLSTTVWLLMDRLHAPGWLWGVVLTLIVILWTAAIYSMATQDRVELAELQDDA